MTPNVIPTNQPGRAESIDTDGFGWANGVMLKLIALYPGDADLESTDFVAPDTGVAVGLVRLIAATRRSLASAYGALGACAAIKPAKSAARVTLRAFTPASRPRASTS